MSFLTHPRSRTLSTLFAVLLIAAQLAWDHTHGGIPSHHFLQRADMPALSNGWGLLLLPVLTWLLVGRMQRRRAADPARARGIGIGFAVALLFGIALSVGFKLGADSLTGALFIAMWLLAAVRPVYRAECVLGFVFGMSTTFGAVLPALVAGVVAGVSALLYRLVYPLVMRVWRMAMARLPPRA